MTVIERCENYVSPSGTKYSKWLCRCECGNEIKVTAYRLKSGNTKSCGCLKKEVNGQQSYKHGEKHSRIYNLYYAMLNRCKNPQAINYGNYGGRGICVCDEWLGENGFINFNNWSMANGYAEDLSIDRIDVNGNYCPENCKWSTRMEQMSNTTRTRLITVDGVTHTLSQWARIGGVRPETIHYRLKRGISPKEAIFTKSIIRKRG